MTEIVKVNLDRTFLFLKIAGMVFGALVACALAYGQIDTRMDLYEIDKAVKTEQIAQQARQVKGMEDKLDKIYEYIVETGK